MESDGSKVIYEKNDYKSENIKDNIYVSIIYKESASKKEFMKVYDD